MKIRLAKTLGEQDFNLTQYFIQNPIKCIIGFIITVGIILLMNIGSERK